MHALLFFSAILGQTTAFDQAMSRFEEAKHRSAWAEAEVHIRQAVSARTNEYAVGSLVWVLLKQNKTQEAFDTSVQMYQHFGNTAYSFVSVIGAGIAEGAWEEIRPFVEYAKQNRIPAAMQWQAQTLKDEVRRFDEATLPTVFKLRWVIPAATLNKAESKIVAFPLLKTNDQTFTYTVQGVVAQEILQSNRNGTRIKLTGSGEDIIIEGTLTLNQTPMGGRPGRKLSQMPLKPESGSDVGPFRYHNEIFDPQNPVISNLAKAVRRESAYTTIQAIFDWRAKEMPYGALPAGKEDTLSRIMKFKTGVCHHISHMAVCLARANGIPAFVVGTLRLPNEATFSGHTGAHGIVSVRFPGQDWVCLEPQDPYSLIGFAGRRDVRFAYQGEKGGPVDINLQGTPVAGSRL